MYLSNLNSEIDACILLIQKIASQAKSGEYFQIWLFPRFFFFFGGGGEGGEWRRSEHVHASYPGALSIWSKISKIQVRS